MHRMHIATTEDNTNQETLADNLRKAGVILSRYVVVEYKQQFCSGHLFVLPAGF